MAQALQFISGKTVFSCPLVDPEDERVHRERYFRDAIPELDYANCFIAPSGPWPARGWVLVRRLDYAALPNLYATTFRLQIDELTNTTSALTFQNLAIVQARCVSRGLAADPQAVYLVELTDARGVLDNPWGQWPTSTSQYNIVAPGYASVGYVFYSLTTNGGPAWTWSTLIGNLWGQMPLLGTYPGLPVTPTGTPEGFAFPGASAWDALTRILDLLGLTVTYNPQLAQPYGIGIIGAADATFSALQAAAVKYRIQDDLEYIDTGAGRASGSVVVKFQKRYQYRGTEETVRSDAFQWQTIQPYSVTIAAPAPYNASPGVSYLWCEFTVRCDIDGNPLAADVATAAAIAQERANQYYSRITRNTLGYLNQVFGGAIGFYAGTLADGIMWRHDRENRLGWTTTVVRGPQPPFEHLRRSWEGE